MGTIVFTWDMVGYACNTQIKHHVESANMLQTWNSIRSLDFILTHPYVDPKRVGITGGSGGGTQTFILTAIDDRICFSAPCVMVSSFFYGGCVCESGMPIHKGIVDGVEYKTNNAEISAIAAPRPQLITSIGKDWTRMVPKWEYPFIKRIYGLFGIEEENLVKNAHFENEVHNYGPSKRQAAYKFFMKYFGIDTKPFSNQDGIIDESLIVVEDESALYVFTDEHPRPKSALGSEEEILDVIGSLQK